MKSSIFPTLLLALLCDPSDVMAQRGPRQPPRQMGMAQGNQNPNNAGAFQQRGRGGQNQAFGNQNRNPMASSPDQLAMMLIARFDADGSGELSQQELANGLMAMRQSMMNMQGNVQNGAGQNMFGANQQAGQQRRPNQGNAFGNRPGAPGDRQNANRQNQARAPRGR